MKVIKEALNKQQDTPSFWVRKVNAIKMLILQTE